MEILFKLVLTVIVALGAWKSLHWLWTSHIDIPASYAKYVDKKPSLADIVVTRDSKKIYQDGVVVADITGPVQTVGGKTIFTQLANVTTLDTAKAIEYERSKLRITGVLKSIGTKSVMNEQGSSVKMNLLEGVSCEKVND